MCALCKSFGKFIYTHYVAMKEKNTRKKKMLQCVLCDMYMCTEYRNSEMPLYSQQQNKENTFYHAFWCGKINAWRAVKFLYYLIHSICMLLDGVRNHNFLVKSPKLMHDSSLWSHDEYLIRDRFVPLFYIVGVVTVIAFTVAIIVDIFVDMLL